MDFQSAEPLKFETPDGITLAARDPIVKAAMVVLGEAWPAPMPFAELLKQARLRLGQQGADQGDDKGAEQTLGQALLTFYAQASTSLVELWLCPPRFTTNISPKPAASAPARHQAQSSGRVTNLRHESVHLGDFERRLLALLDGSHDRPALIEGIAAAVSRGELNVEKDGQPVRDEKQLQEVIGQAVDRQLGILARNALLVD
jgi:methyltransferase-like protein